MTYSQYNMAILRVLVHYIKLLDNSDSQYQVVIKCRQQKLMTSIQPYNRALRCIIYEEKLVFDPKMAKSWISFRLTRLFDQTRIEKDAKATIQVPKDTIERKEISMKKGRDKESLICLSIYHDQENVQNPSLVDCTMNNQPALEEREEDEKSVYSESSEENYMPVSRRKQSLLSLDFSNEPAPAPVEQPPVYMQEIIPNAKGSTVEKRTSSCAGCLMI